MKTMKKSTLFFFLSCIGWLCLFPLLTSCDKDEESPSATQNKLVGIWEAVPTLTYYASSPALRIAFKADQTIGLYPVYQGDRYHLLSETQLEIIKKENEVRQIYTISFNENQTLTIYNFQDGTDTYNIKNITFKKTE